MDIKISKNWAFVFVLLVFASLASALFIGFIIGVMGSPQSLPTPTPTLNYICEDGGNTIMPIYLCDENSCWLNWHIEPECNPRTFIISDFSEKRIQIG